MFIECFIFLGRPAQEADLVLIEHTPGKRESSLPVCRDLGIGQWTAKQSSIAFRPPFTSHDETCLSGAVRHSRQHAFVGAPYQRNYTAIEKRCQSKMDCSRVPGSVPLHPQVCAPSTGRSLFS